MPHLRKSTHKWTLLCLNSELAYYGFQTKYIMNCACLVVSETDYMYVFFPLNPVLRCFGKRNLGPTNLLALGGNGG